MAKICFVTYEIHPTTRGGCGVLLHHAAELLLQAGHEVTFLLAIPEHEFDQFVTRDHPGFSNSENCRAFHLGTLCEDFTLREEDCPSRSVHESARFAHACERLFARERFDFVEFFEYCGVAYYAMARRLFGRGAAGRGGAPPVLGTRLHNSLELIDGVGSTRYLDRSRYHLYALEHAQLALSELVLTPTDAYFKAYYKDRYHLAATKVVVSQSPKLPFPPVTRRPDPKEAFSIVFVGRLFQFKGVDQLVLAGVELLTRRPDLRCTFDIIGADASESPLGHSYKEYLLSLIPRAMRGRFEFPGNLSQGEFSKRLDRALFAVFPNRFESFCYAAHEVYDAGVPMIVRDLPGWSDFFAHGRNALVYEGRTDDLVSRMEEMIDDGPLRERLCRPYEIATEPLGSLYSKPKALDPLASPAPSLPRVLVVVLCERDAGLRVTLGALEGQDSRPHQVVVLHAAEPGATGSFWWLGRAWELQDSGSEPKAKVRPTSLHTYDAIVMLRAGDVPDREWLKSCSMALGNRSNAAFAGTWGRREHEGKSRPIPSILDLAPETYPFEQGQRATRAVIRTSPGQVLIDLLDPVLAGLGEIGLIWRAVGEHGPGVMLDEPLLRLAPEDEHDWRPPDPSILKYLLAKYSHPFADRLALYAGLMRERVDALHSQVRGLAAQANLTLPPPTNIDPPLEHKVRVADELGGKTLARLALKKLTRKLSGNKPQG